jgi:hypothetical protein
MTCHITSASATDPPSFPEKKQSPQGWMGRVSASLPRNKYMREDLLVAILENAASHNVLSPSSVRN